MYSKFFQIPPKSLIILDPKMVSWWFPIHSVVVVSWGPGGPLNHSEIHHRSIAPPSLRAQHPGATSSGVAGPAIGPRRSDRFGKYQKMKKTNGRIGPVSSVWYCVDAFRSKVVSSNCWRSNLVQAKRPKTVQSPEWSGLTHITLICSCLAPLLKQKLCQSRSEVSVIG